MYRVDLNFYLLKTEGGSFRHSFLAGTVYDIVQSSMRLRDETVDYVPPPETNLLCTQRGSSLDYLIQHQKIASVSSLPNSIFRPQPCHLCSSRTMKRPSSGLALLGGAVALLMGGASGQSSCVQVSNVAFDPAVSKLTFQMEGETTVVANTVSRGSEEGCRRRVVLFVVFV